MIYSGFPYKIQSALEKIYGFDRLRSHWDGQCFSWRVGEQIVIYHPHHDLVTTFKQEGGDYLLRKLQKELKKIKDIPLKNLTPEMKDFGEIIPKFK